MLITRALIAASFLVTLTACQKESAPAVDTAATAQSGHVQAAIPASSSSVISVTPSSLQNCDKGIEATVSWDASKAKVTTESTEIWVGTDAASMKLFSAGGAAGQTQTGPWTRPGTRFNLRNKQDGRTLGEATVGGTTCN